MKELSLNILDIAQNSITARASLIRIDLDETPDTLTIRITDNGCGMSREMVFSVTDPFCTTRKTRKVGLGIPFYKLAAEQTGGSLSIESKPEAEYPSDHGTVVTAVFKTDSIDFTPLGDIVSTIGTLIQGMGNIDLIFTHKFGNFTVTLDTTELKETLGSDIPLSTPDVLVWINEFLKEQYNQLEKERNQQ